MKASERNGETKAVAHIEKQEKENKRKKGPQSTRPSRSAQRPRQWWAVDFHAPDDDVGEQHQQHLPQRGPTSETSPSTKYSINTKVDHRKKTTIKPTLSVASSALLLPPKDASLMDELQSDWYKQPSDQHGRASRKVKSSVVRKRSTVSTKKPTTAAYADRSSSPQDELQGDWQKPRAPVQITAGRRTLAFTRQIRDALTQRNEAYEDDIFDGEQFKSAKLTSGTRSALGYKTPLIKQKRPVTIFTPSPSCGVISSFSVFDRSGVGPSPEILKPFKAEAKDGYVHALKKRRRRD